MNETINNLSLTDVFTQIPVVHFKTIKVHCPDCQSALLVHHTDTRRAYSLHIGVFNAHRTFMHCPICNKVYPPEDFENIVPKYSNVGYDIIVFIGRLIFLEYHTLRETMQALEGRNIHISSSEVAYLAKKFIIYLSILHKQARIKLKELIQKKGGYILHIDGTSEGASPHLISAIDEISNFVLANVKVPGESKEQVIPFLQEIKEQYSIIRNTLKKYGITSQLRYRLRYYFENKTGDINVSQINETIKTAKRLNGQDSQIVKQICHILILWALDGKNYGNGFGFPFDKPHNEFYRRLGLLYRKLKSFQNKCDDNKLISKLVDDLSPLINDIEYLEAYQIFSEKEKVFDKLRHALSIALPTTANRLNDNGEDVEIKTIKNRVKEFKEWFLQEEYQHKNNDYQKLIGQIEKYWGKLFSDPIQITSPEGYSFIQPQRTNNIIEQFFRGIRRAHRRTTGNNSMCKKLQSMFADTLLVKNLNNPDYMKVILDGNMSLVEKFAEIDHEQVIARTKDAGNDENKIPRKIKNMIRENKTMDKIIIFKSSISKNPKGFWNYRYFSCQSKIYFLR